MSKHMTRGNPRIAVAYLRASKNEQLVRMLDRGRPAYLSGTP